MSKTTERCEYIFKLVILGDSSVGKTNMLLRFSQDTYKPTHLPTIGVDFKIKMMTVDGKRVKCQLWDTAGQERFKTITETYYKGASGVILVYSIGDRKSFNGITNWMNQINERQASDIPKIIVGNKCDLKPQERCVTMEEGKALADKFGAIFYEASAKENTNIKEVFESLCRQVMKKTQKEAESQENTVAGTGLSLEPKNRFFRKKFNCCQN